MRKKHKGTLRSVFSDPVSGTITWRDIEKLLTALGGKISEGRGSRVRVYLNGVRAVFHRPHPGRETDKRAVQSVRRFLMATAIAPEATTPEQKD